MINLASKNIIEIREENILTGLNQNKKLIEECNKLKEDNDYLVKKYKQYNKVIKEANRNNKRLQEETMNKKQGAINSKMHLENNLLLDIQNNNARLNEEIQNDANLPDGVKLPNVNNNRNGHVDNRGGEIQDEIIEG